MRKLSPLTLESNDLVAAVFKLFASSGLPVTNSQKKLRDRSNSMTNGEDKNRGVLPAGAASFTFTVSPCQLLRLY